jgi:exonuclease VII large subunit
LNKKKYKEQEESIRKKNESERKAIESLRQDVEVRRRELKALRAELSKKQAKRDELKQIALTELTVGSPPKWKIGPGPIYEIKKANADKAEKEVNELNELIIQRQNKFTEIEGALTSRIENLDTSEKNDINDLKNKRKKIGKYDGLAARLEALGELTTKNDTLLFAYIFITLLFFTIETAPIFVKLISSKGPYDFILEEKSRKTIAGYTDSQSIHVQPQTVKEPEKKTEGNPEPTPYSIWRQRYEDTIRANRERKKAGGN